MTAVASSVTVLTDGSGPLFCIEAFGVNKTAIDAAAKTMTIKREIGAIRFLGVTGVFIQISKG